MENYFFTFALTITITSFTNPNQLQRCIRKLLTYQPHSIEKTQRSLMRTVKKTHNLTPTAYHHIIGALTRGAHFKELLKNVTTLHSAVEELWHVPGFEGTLKKVITNAHSQAMVKGHGFELEAALILNKTENVTGLSQHIRHGKHKREIDIVTDQRWIECKFNPRNNKKLKRQLLAQQKLLQKTNKPLAHTLFSKVSPTQPLQDWLKKNNIGHNHH